MGAPIGYFSDQQPNDYPELNKCPDCETFFKDLHCPLCGKECPEEYRAGNRKPVKQKKPKSYRSSGRVQFVPWYHSAWFIVAMLVVFPIVGLVLLWQSDIRRPWKIAGTLVPIFVQVLPGVIGMLAMGWQSDPFGVPEDREAYIASCETVSSEGYYRNAAEYYGKDVALELTVVDKRLDEVGQASFVNCYYECRAVINGRTYTVLIADCQAADARVNLTAGDAVTVYGTGYGNLSISDPTVGAMEAPAVIMYFVSLHS